VQKAHDGEFQYCGWDGAAAKGCVVGGILVKATIMFVACEAGLATGVDGAMYYILESRPCAMGEIFPRALVGPFRLKETLTCTCRRANMNSAKCSNVATITCANVATATGCSTKHHASRSTTFGRLQPHHRLARHTAGRVEIICVTSYPRSHKTVHHVHLQGTL
jgi:hypothetical protein